MVVVEAGEGAASTSLPSTWTPLRAYRRAETTGNAFRRPAAYRSLTYARIAHIFVRVDRYGRSPGV
jgi:N-carbamoylputrescine amidase